MLNRSVNSCSLIRYLKITDKTMSKITKDHWQESVSNFSLVLIWRDFHSLVPFLSRLLMLFKKKKKKRANFTKYSCQEIFIEEQRGIPNISSNLYLSTSSVLNIRYWWYIGKQNYIPDIGYLMIYRDMVLNTRRQIRHHTERRLYM